MRHSPDELLDAIDEEAAKTCSVCGDFKMPHDDYCPGCTRYKELADSREKARKRVKAFGRIL